MQLPSKVEIELSITVPHLSVNPDGIFQHVFCDVEIYAVSRNYSLLY